MANYPLEELTKAEKEVAENIENLKFSIKILGPWFNSEIRSLENSIAKQLDETQKTNLIQEDDENLKIFNIILKATEELENIDRLDMDIQSLREFKKRNEYNLEEAIILLFTLAIFIISIPITLMVIYGRYKHGQTTDKALESLKELLNRLP
ncbi:MAG: hypothetical protein C5B43_00560 [Verrucomicrobia bacterium]|nr:MAG: hypothetical protein C5B43_00560 [Verrucomicrobiota bacterium]